MLEKLYKADGKRLCMNQGVGGEGCKCSELKLIHCHKHGLSSPLVGVENTQTNI